MPFLVVDGRLVVDDWRFWVQCFLDVASSLMVRATFALIELVTGVATDSVDSLIIVYDQTSGGQFVFRP